MLLQCSVSLCSHKIYNITACGQNVCPHQLFELWVVHTKGQCCLSDTLVRGLHFIYSGAFENLKRGRDVGTFQVYIVKFPNFSIIFFKEGQGQSLPKYARLSTNATVKQESCAIAKETAQCALYMGALKIFGTPWLQPRPLFPTFSWAFVPIDRMNVPTKFEVRSFTRSWDNRGYPKNLGSPWIHPRSLFCKIFNGLLFG